MKHEILTSDSFQENYIDLERKKAKYESIVIDNRTDLFTLRINLDKCKIINNFSLKFLSSNSGTITIKGTRFKQSVNLEKIIGLNQIKFVECKFYGCFNISKVSNAFVSLIDCCFYEHVTLPNAGEGCQLLLKNCSFPNRNIATSGSLVELFSSEMTLHNFMGLRRKFVDYDFDDDLEKIIKSLQKDSKENIKFKLKQLYLC